ncbi:MAG TPA: hypothetical protein VE439_05180 [Anaerolineae bacterium]|jgi:hypothetical protein|nr:hypothetical protein [Anaerolineae bacterium]
MSKRKIFKKIIGAIIEKKYSIYGQLLVAKISATDLVSLSPTGEVIAINGDPKHALEAILNIFKEISGNVGIASAVTDLEVFSTRYVEVKADIDEVISKF